MLGVSLQSGNQQVEAFLVSAKGLVYVLLYVSLDGLHSLICGCSMY